MSTTPERTTGTSGTTDLDQLVARLDELQCRSDALTAALERARSTRRFIMIAFLAFVVISGWRFYALANTITSKQYQDKLLAEFQKAIEGNQDVLGKEAQHLVDGITPVVTAAFSEQAKKDLPLFMAVIDKEREALIASLPQRMQERVEGHYHQMIRRHEKLIQTEFPTVQNEEVRNRMMANTCAALDRLVQKYYVEEFKKELLAMSNTWNDFPPAPMPSAGDSPLEDQLLGELMDLVSLKLSRRPLAQ